MPKYIPDYALNKSLQKKLSQNNLGNLIFDSRERNTRLVKYLLESNITPKFQQLPEGDYFFPQDDILIERKFVDDLNKSISSGRLYDQIDRLNATGKRVFLVIEGEFGYGKIHPNGVLGAQIGISIRYKISIIRTKNFLETLNLLMLISEKMKKGGYGETLYYQTNTEAQYVKDPQIKILTSLPGCGVKIAQIILDYCGSIKNFVNTDSQELTKIEGLGPKTIQKRKDILNSDNNS